ncbi:MAG: hypothetical protein AAGL10_06690 [Pseudomonadota bacterium]
MTHDITRKAGVLGRGPAFWGVLMLIAFAAIAFLHITDAVEETVAAILYVVAGSLIVPLMVSASRQIDSGDGQCVTKGEAQKRYIKRIAIATSLYMVAMGLLVWVMNTDDPSPALRFGLALLPGFAVIGVFWAIGRLIVEEQDEFIRMLVVRQSLIATGFALSLASVWGFLETAGVVPHADAYWWPVMWFLGLAIGAVANRLEYGAWGAV